MAEITPAQPSEGGIWLAYEDVPAGWEAIHPASTRLVVEWFTLNGRCTDDEWGDVWPTCIVEARPPRPRMVTVELSEEDAQRLIRSTVPSDSVHVALAAALAELDAEQ